ncbi:PAS domain-containing protein [Croceicoccus mobilis]|uniref:PAS domain-containing protein n=1 Tax=Croceicoccus mobilis TaxID=1703339 RepID=A0A916YVJ3_9SPHN|nr:PAS domain-containing protein [Croceicoccus mobilis]GGD63096.1 hypothetical protein GCM10010990_10700 [Croceicoccus mobilis]
MAEEGAFSVSAADFVRAFSKWREQANRDPVFVTNHGRTTHVMLSTQAYERLVSGEEQRERGDEVVDMAEWIDEAVLLCDGNLKILFANRVASAICRRPARELIGQILNEALPEVAGSLLDVHARRTVVGGEPSAADIPSPFTENAWLRFQCFPLGSRNVIIFRDITEDVQRYRLADVKSAILSAMAIHGTIGYVRVSVRGTIDRVDDPFCQMLELPEARLLGVQLVDLVAMERRAEFREALEAVLRGRDPRNFRSQFLSNKGTLIDVTISIVQLHGAYGAEGAIVLLTPVQSGEQPARLRA